MSDINEEKDKENEGGKVQRKYEAAMKKALAIIGGKSILWTPGKSPNDDIAALVAELTEEKVKATREETKVELRNLLDAHITMKKDLAKKEQEIQQLKKQKMESFIEAANKFFNKIENSDKYVRDMEAALREAAGGQPVTEENSQNNTTRTDQP